MRTDNLYVLPDDLPVPVDDGACDHLRGSLLPSIGLRATSGATVDLSKDGRPWLVVYCYPRTGRPDQEPLGGAAAWNSIPGARGCTPQSCAYRDHHAELAALGAAVYGLSTQDTEYQTEAVARLHLPFPLLSDERLDFARSLRLPTFDFAGSRLIKRLTIIARAGRIEEVFYPVFPSDADASQVIEWLSSRSSGPKAKTHLPPTAIALGFIECINRGDLGSLIALMSDDHRLEIFDEPPVVGRAANESAWRGYMTSFPRYVIHPRRISTPGETVAILGHTTGSHLGLPDAEEQEILLIWLADVRNGSVERWRLIGDTPSARKELGLE